MLAYDNGTLTKEAVMLKGSHQWAPQMGIFFVGLAAGNIWVDY